MDYLRCRVESSIIKPCPFCGGEAYFAPMSAMSNGITCKKCKVHGIPVSLPGYWSKGGNRLFSRMFMRAVNHWNSRA